MDTTAQICPRCGAFAQLTWRGAAYGTFYTERPGGLSISAPRPLEGWRVAECAHCEKVSVWSNGVLIYPAKSDAPRPHAELPDDVLADYREAATVASLSPRGAAALLRLALEKLCHHLSPGPDKINGAIRRLVAVGLQSEVQIALDAVRVIGNEAVHPGRLDLQDNTEIVLVMFDLINLIAERMISEPRKAREIYGRLPQAAKGAIERRDAPGQLPKC